MALPIDDILKRWECRVRVGGQTIPAMGLPARRLGLDTYRTSSTVPIQFNDTIPADTPATIEVGINGQWVQFFTGTTDERSEDMPVDRTLTVVDDLGQLRRTPDEPLLFDGISWVDAVVMVLEAAGITNLAQIDDPGLMVGEIYPIEIAITESLDQVLAELLEYASCRATVYPGGYIRIIKVSGVPAAGTSMTYAFSPGPGEHAVYADGASRKRSGNAEAIKTVVISGPTRADGITPTYVLTADDSVLAKGGVYTKSYRYVQTGAVAQTLAQRELAQRAREKQVISFSAPANPGLLPGMTIGFRYPLIGIATTTPAYVMSVAINGVDMTVELWLGASAIIGWSPQAAPIADFSITVEYEPFDDVSRYVVSVKDLSSDPDGEVVRRRWLAPGAHVEEIHDVTEFAFLYDDITGKTITLTVWDNEDLSGELAQVIPTDTVQRLTRQLTVAEAGGWAVMTDGDTWEFWANGSAECTATPPFNEHDYILSGWSNGQIRITTDGLKTKPPPLQATVTGSVAFLFSNEGDPDNVLIGHGTSLSRSTTRGASPSLLRNFGAGQTVRDGQSSPDQPNEIFLAVGSKAVHTYGPPPGKTWASPETWQDWITGPSGSSCMQVATAPWGHVAVFESAGSDVEAFKSHEGYVVDWTNVDSPPHGLTSVTPMLSAEGWIVAEGTGRVFVIVKEIGTWFARELTDSADGTTRDLLRDGQLPSLAFQTGPSGTHKVLNSQVFTGDPTIGLIPNGDPQGTVHLVRANAGYQIGYGSLGAKLPVPVVAGFILLPYGRTGATDVIWHFQDGASVPRQVTPPQPNWYWFGLVVDPFNSSRWLCWGSKTGAMTVQDGNVCDETTGLTIVYASDDQGGTWTPLTVPAGAVPGGSGIYFPSFEYSHHTNGVVVAAAQYPVSGGNSALLWRGTLSSLGSPAISAQSHDEQVDRVRVGVNDDVVVTTGHWTFLRLAGSSTVTNFSWDPDNGGDGQGSDLPLSGLQMVALQTIFTAGWALNTSNYRTAAPLRRTAAYFNPNLISQPNLMANGVAFAGGQAGITKIVNPLATPTITYGHGGTSGNIDAIRSDRRARTAVAALWNNGSKVTISRDGGSTWSTIDLSTFGVVGVAEYIEVTT